MKKILFICTGNTCRSPMAEGLFRLAAMRRGVEAEVRSAGVSAINGVPMSKHSASILKEKGDDPAGRHSQELNPSLVEWADLILTMTMSHKNLLLQRFPLAVEKTYTLKEFAASAGEGPDGPTAEREKLLSELQIKLALNEPITDSDKARLMELERQLPDYDIADPFGSHLEIYRECAAEIEEAIERAIDKLTRE